MSTRHIAIGDIHGCAREFEELLSLVSPGAEDQVILLGDLVNRGPDSLRVLDLARSAKAISLLGNHEARLRDYRRHRDLSLIKKEDYECLGRLRPGDWDYLEQMPLTHQVPELNTVFVHGGFLPGSPWEKQTDEIVTRIQVIDEKGRPRKRSDCDEGVFWADLWEGPPFVVYGHTPRPEIHKTPWSIGIDTGCVLGGQLTALILPEKKLVQVKAHAVYHGRG